MSLVQRCDSCGLVGTTDAAWLHLRRRGTGPLFAAFGETSEPDPILGTNGLAFHTYDCLRVWLMALDPAEAP